MDQYPNTLTIQQHFPQRESVNVNPTTNSIVYSTSIHNHYPHMACRYQLSFTRIATSYLAYSYLPRSWKSQHSYSSTILLVSQHVPVAMLIDFDLMLASQSRKSINIAHRNSHFTKSISNTANKYFHYYFPLKSNLNIAYSNSSITNPSQ